MRFPVPVSCNSLRLSRKAPRQSEAVIRYRQNFLFEKSSRLANCRSAAGCELHIGDAAGYQWKAGELF